MSGQGGQLPAQVLADQLTLYQPEGADCAPHITTAHLALGSFLRHWKYVNTSLYTASALPYLL